MSLEYQYRCPSCKAQFTTHTPADIQPCPVCKYQAAKREFVFQARNSNPEHFNHTTGTFVQNDRELRDALKRKGDEQSERLDFEHRYEYLTRAEMADMSAHGVTEEGLDATARKQHDALQ